MTYVGPAGEDTTVCIGIPAWTTTVPGLVVNAAIGDYRGRFTLTHAASGRNFNRFWDSISDASDAARRIGDLCDWTRSDPLSVVDIDELKALLDDKAPVT